MMTAKNQNLFDFADLRIEASCTEYASSTDLNKKMAQSSEPKLQRSVVSCFLCSEAADFKVALFRRSEKVKTYQYVYKTGLASTQHFLISINNSADII